MICNLHVLSFHYSSPAKNFQVCPTPRLSAKHRVSYLSSTSLSGELVVLCLISSKLLANLDNIISSHIYVLGIVNMPVNRLTKILPNFRFASCCVDLPCFHKWVYEHCPSCTIGVFSGLLHFWMPRSYIKTIKPLKKYIPRLLQLKVNSRWSRLPLVRAL